MPRHARLLTRLARASRLALLGLLMAAGSVQGQTPPRDSVEIVRQMHRRQQEFERFREERTPLIRATQPDGACDQMIGRICIWFGGEEEENVPAELREVGQARVELIRSLFDAFDRIRDRWVLGQLVHYLVESRNLGEAERVAEQCGIAESWWCSALRGYAVHVGARYLDAEAAFREAIGQMPEEVRRAWTSPRYIFTRGAAEEFARRPAMEREQAWELLWRLSDPLFLFEGNDYLTDHYARLVVAENERGVANPLQLEWDEDLEETLIRYGRNTGYSRVQGGRMQLGRLQDTRRMTGHHHPKSRGYLFPESFLSSPSDVPPESWVTPPRESRNWYAPPYAPEVRGLETQVGRFRRDDAMLVVGAYRPTLPDERTGRALPAWRPGEGIRGEPHAALFLVPVDGSEWTFVRGSEAEGVLSIRTMPGRYVSGLEVVDLEGRQAWRARQGIVQLPLLPSLVDVSDLMILREDAPLPASLDEAIPLVRPGVRLRRGERLPVVWEVYGLRVEEPVRVTIGFSRGRPGFLERVGEFLGVITPAQPVDITFDDRGPDEVQAVFRAVELQLPDLSPGEYTLHLRLELPGRTPVLTSRPIVVE
jgi:hypothetical protein